MLQLLSLHECSDRWPVVDTGSSDTWVVSTICEACFVSLSGDHTISPPPFFPAVASHTKNSSFSPAGIDVDLLYGDSNTATHASGVIGRDIVGLAGLALKV